MSKALSKFRKKIDQCDDKILEILIERAKLAKKIGLIKNKSGAEVYSSAREQAILQRLISRKTAPLTSDDVENIFSEVLHACRNLQRRLRVAYFGPEATFTHQLALKHFGQRAQFFPHRTIADVFTEVERSRADYGVVPVENSTEGVVTHTLDMFVESDLKICAEREEPIAHYLLSASGDLNKIKKLFFFPQALGQCRKWVTTHLPKVELVEALSTADAAAQASCDGDSAAIASHLAGKIYHLKTVAPNIQDYSENYTRFLIIGKQNPAPSGQDKTSILFSIKDRVGALNDILLIFKTHDLNLTKIESRPSKKKAWQYLFFADFLGSATDPKIQRAMDEIKNLCLQLKLLGSYPIND